MHLLYDSETSGLDPKVDRVIEIGAMVVDDDWTDFARLSLLVWDSSYPPITPEITELTGITPEDLAQDGVPPAEAFNQLSKLAAHLGGTGFIVAYNAVFDLSFFAREMALGNFLDKNLDHMLWQQWLCAMQDIEHPPKFKCRKQSHLAVDYGVKVDPERLHRAIGDVELMREILVASGVRAAAMSVYHNEPSVYIQALIPAPWKDDGAGVALAKKRGFSYERALHDDRVFAKSWVKKIKRSKLPMETDLGPFNIRSLE